MSIAESSAIFLSAIRKYSASFLRREPSHSGQGFSSMKSFAQRCMEALLSVSWYCCSMKLTIPSKSIEKSRVSPITSDFSENFSFPPKRIISIASLGSFSTGSESLCPNFLSIVSICWNIQVFFSAPMAVIAPCLIESDISGMSLLRVTSCTIPSPLQCGHIPLGELKEKVFGSGSG